MYTQNIGLKHIPALETHQLWDEIHCIQFDNREALIVVDDFTRPKTPITRMVVEYAISEVGEDKVAVVVASGLHRANTHHEVSETIGPDLTRRLRIYQHSPLCNFPLWQDKWNVIGVGCVIPHTFAGLSGDCKISLPGLSNYESIMAFHAASHKEASDLICSTKKWVNTYVNYTINCFGEPIRIFTYPSTISPSEFRCDAWGDYTVKLPEPTDAAVLIPRFKNSDFQQSMNAMRVFTDTGTPENHPVPVKDGGCICIASPTPEGIGVHYGFQQPNGISPAFYDDVFAKQYENKIICFVCPELPELAIQEYFKRSIFNFSTMEEFTNFVEHRWGRTCSVAFYHAADIMIGEKA